MGGMTRRGFLRNTAAAPLGAGMLAALAEERSFRMSEGELRAGVARRDITPQPGAPLWGYSNRTGPATGTLDPLYAKALVLASGDQTIALVTLDLGRMPLAAPCERIRERVRAKGVQDVILSASHTHSAPVMETQDAPYALEIEDRIGACIEEAAAHLGPARVGVARAEADISHNRRVIKDGECYMFWRNAERKPTSPVDHEVRILKIDMADGAPLAILANYACHPVILGPDNLEYSADYVGEMARIVEEATGATCMFLQGGCGDINPYLDKTPRSERGVELMREEGAKVGRAILGAIGSLKTRAPANPSLALTRRLVEVGLRWNLDDPRQVEVFRSLYSARYDVYLAPLKPDQRVLMSVLTLNGEIPLVFMPGELFVQFQLDLKRNSPLPDVFFCGYTDEFHAYFPTVKDAAAGGYGGLSVTFVGLGAGEKLITEAAIEIGKHGGRFRPFFAAEDIELKELT